MTASETGDDVAQCVVTPHDFAAQIATRYRLGRDEVLRIAFHAGPGDAAGSFNHWQAGAHDPRVPIMAYSTQFFTLADRLGADAHILTEPPHQPLGGHPRIRFTQIARDRAQSGARWHLEQMRYAWRFLAEIWRIRPHVTIMGTDFPFWAYTALPRDTSLIVSMHNTFWPMGLPGAGTKARLKRALAGRGLRRMAAAVCTSPECLRQLVAVTGRDAGVFVEFPQLPAMHLPPLRARDAARDLLYLGRIEADKGVFDLLAAFTAIAATYPDITLSFAGSGTAAPALQAAIERSPHAGRVRFAGQLSAEGVAAALQACDLLICPTRSSFSEGLALVVIEAAAAGVPSVVSSVVPAQELVPDACTPFPADDSAALARALSTLIETPATFRARVAGTAPARAQVLDRRSSWGSQLARAMLCPE